MITFLLVLCAMWEFLKLVGAENWVAFTVRTRRLDLDRKVWEEKKKAGYDLPKPEPDASDMAYIIMMMPVALIYLFVLLWVAIFGGNLYAQGIAIVTLVLSIGQTALMKRVSLDSTKFRITYTIIDSFIGVLSCGAMAYFYQRPL